MSDFESNVGLNIDVSQALTAIKTLQRQISDFHSSLAKGSATANLKSLQMQQSLIDTINATGQYSAQMKTVASATQTFTTALEKNKLSMGQYFKYAGGASKSFGRFFKSEMDTIQKVAIERVKDLQTQYIKMGRDANGAIRSIAVRPLALDMENLATKTQIAAQKQQLLNQLLKQGSTNLLNFGKNTQWAGRQLMVGFTIPLGIFGATAAKTFMQMEEQAIKFKRVYGDTFTATKETDAMLKQVQQLATEFTKYGVAVEKTMEQAAKAAATGKMGADLLAQVSEATRLSVLGNVEQAQALETTISLTNAFGTAADQLRGKINFLNAVENQTVTSIEDLTIAIPKAAPVIQQLGGDVEDLTFFLTAMREGGINASESANALKSGLASLINPTKKASDFLQGFGININKIVEGNKGNVQGLVVDFAKALDTLDPLNRARAIEQLFGKFQFSRLSTLFQNVIKDGSQAAKVLELTRQSSAELGILAQRELNKISASPMYKFQKAIADFKKELAPVGEEFLKAVTPIIQFGTDILKAFNNLDGGVKQFIVNATGLVAGLGPIFLMTFGLIANGVANIIKGFTFVKTVFNKASSASTILGETTDYMTQQQIEAAAAAASLEQVHNKLTQAFTVETTAVGKLAAAYQKAVSAQNAFTGPPATGKPRRAKKYADGVFSVPGPKGAGDIVPAMLSPGEAVIPAKMASRYSGFINGMISGSIPGFNKGKPLSERLKVKGSSDAPGFIRSQSKNFNWKTRDAEIQAVMDVASQYGYNIDDVFKNNYLTTHASHLESSFRQVNLGRGLMDKIKQWFAKNLMPDLGIINKPLQDISAANITQLGKGSSKRKILEEFEKSIPQIAKELGMSEKEVKRLGMQTLTGKHPTNKKSAAVASRIFGIAEGQATSLKDKARYGGARKVLSMRTDPGNDFYKTAKNRKYVDNEAKRIEYENDILEKKKQVVKEATNAEVKALGTRRKVAESQEKGAKQARRAAVAQTSSEKQKTRTAQTEKKLSKKEEDRLKREAANKAKSTSQTKVSATPKIRTTEQLGDGLKRVVTTESNGKQTERYYLEGRKGSVSAKDAQAMLAARRGATTPGGKLKGFFSGTMGKLGMASMLASMGASAIPGVSGTGIDSTLSTLSYGLMGAEAAKGLFGGRQKFDAEGNPLPSRLDNIKKSETYKNISSKISGSKMAGRFGQATGAAKTFKLDAAASVASKGLMKSMPMLAKGVSMVALRFLNVIPIVGQIALGLEIAYNVLTINARKQEEISKAVIDTLTMTKDKLTGLNEFFGTEATLSGIRTATPGVDATPQGSLVKQFMESEQFKNTYKETAGKLRGASNEQFGITMQSLALDLYGQGMGEEQVQIIIDAIKTEAGKTDLVINFKDLKLDTEAGMKNLGNSISKITDGAIREFKSNRDWLGINWEAQTKLDEFEAQMSGFISAISQEFEKGRISVQEFEAAFRNIQLSAVKLEEANAGDGIAHLKDVMERTNPQLAQAAMLISDVTTYLNMMKAAAMGVNLSENLLTDLGAPEGSDARKNAEDYLKRASDYEKDKSKKIDKLNKKLAGTTKQSQNLEKQEQGINDLFDKRIKALERINQLQEQISKQKQNELDLADALSRGDVFAAAQAQQKIRADQASLALEQQKAALQDEKDKQLGGIQDKQDAVAGGAQKIQDEIAKVNNSKFSEVYKTDTKSLRQMYESVKQPFGFMTMPGSLFMSEEDKFKMFTDMMGSFLDLKKSLGFQSGGYISGPGSGTSDSIPARLSNGEYVLRAKAVDALGVDTLDMLNYAEKFANGGYVDTNSIAGINKASKKKVVQYGTPTKSNSLSVMADIKRLQEINAQAKDSNPFNDASPEYRKKLIKNIAVYKSLYGDPTSSTLTASQLKSQASSAMTKQQLGILGNDTSGVMETARFASYLTPVLGTGVAISETANSASRGDALGTALNALGVIPGIGGASKIIEKIGTKIGPSKLGSALTKTGSSGFNAYQAVNNFLPSLIGKGASKLASSKFGDRVMTGIEDYMALRPIRLQQSKQADKTITDFGLAAMRMRNYINQNGINENADELSSHLATYAQLLAKNERYAFGTPGRLSQNTTGFYNISKMKPEEVLQLALGIKSSNFGVDLKGTSGISPYQVLTGNKNYRVQAPGRIEDFLYTRGIIPPSSSIMSALGQVREAGQYLMPASGPFAHILGGKKGETYVSGEKRAILPREVLASLGVGIDYRLMQTVKNNKKAGLFQNIGAFFNTRSSYNPILGPLSTRMTTKAMQRSDNVFGHENQHISDIFNETFGDTYRSTFGISQAMRDAAKNNPTQYNALYEAAAQAQSALLNRSEPGMADFYNWIPIKGAVQLTKEMTPEDLILRALYNMDARNSLPFGFRSHQFSPEWFTTYATEILKHRQSFSAKNPNRSLPINSDIDLNASLALGDALRKYNIDSYNPDDFVKNVSNFFEEQLKSRKGTDGFEPINALYNSFKNKAKNAQIAAQKEQKISTSGPSSIEKWIQGKLFGKDIRDFVNEQMYDTSKTISPALPSPSAGPSSVRSLTDSLTASAQITDSYMMDLIDPSDFRKAFKEVFANRGTIGSYANPDLLGMRNLFGDFGLGGTLPAGNFSARKGIGMVASELPKKMALIEASIAAINYQKNGSGVESIATLMAMTPQWRSWQKMGVSTANYMPNLMRYGQMNPNEAVLASLAMELAQLRNTASIIPDIAFRGGRKADEFMDAVDSVMTPFDPERYLRGDDSIQILESKKFEPVNFDPKNPVFKELLAQPQDAVQEFFKTIYSGMDISKTGFRVANEALRATVVPGANPRIGFGGSIQKLDATAPFSGLVGDFSRVMYDEHIFHDLFMIQEAFRGKGISSALSPITEELYRLFGMNRIEMIAGLESGPVTWAKAGYKFNGNPQEVSNAILNKLNSPALPKEEKVALEKIYNDLQKDTISITPKDILNTSSKTNPSLGRDILYGTSYSAVKLLKDIPLNKELSRQVYSLVEQASKVSGINIMDFIPKFKNGGMFRTGYSQGGLAMLHDKEFVMNAGAVKDYGVNNLKAMNNGTYTGGSVYNSYGVNINVGNSNASANDIARTVIKEIKRIDSQNIRSTKV